MGRDLGDLLHNFGPVEKVERNKFEAFLGGFQMTIDFSHEHKTGVEVLDHEHQVLMSTLNTISFLLTDNVDLPRIKTAINLFHRMAKAHFRNEEEILEITDHPDKESHKEEHQKLEKELDEIFLSSQPEKLADVLNKLRTWLTPHMLEWDTKIKIKPNLPNARTIMSQFSQPSPYFRLMLKVGGAEDYQKARACDNARKINEKRHKYSDC